MDGKWLVRCQLAKRTILVSGKTVSLQHKLKLNSFNSYSLSYTVKFMFLATIRSKLYLHKHRLMILRIVTSAFVRVLPNDATVLLRDDINELCDAFNVFTPPLTPTPFTILLLVVKPDVMANGETWLSTFSPSLVRIQYIFLPNGCEKLFAEDKSERGEDDGEVCRDASLLFSFALLVVFVFTKMMD